MTNYRRHPEAFNFKCLETNAIVCRIQSASAEWVKICKNRLKKNPPSSQKASFSNQLLSLLLSLPLGVFARDLEPSKFPTTASLDNGTGPKLEKAEPPCVQMLTVLHAKLSEILGLSSPLTPDPHQI